MRCIGLIVLALGPLAAWAQNLVVNPSFEEYVHCPSDLSQIDSVIGWESIFGTPDYFNACADDTMTVPYNPLGYQWPSDGLGYAGLGFYDIWYKEYIQGRLVAPVQPGVLTYVSMRVSPGGFGYPGWTSPNLMASHIGLRFSTQPLGIQTAYGSLEFNGAVLYLPTMLNDTANWTVLSTAFIPDSAYAYLQIGNFFSDGLCSWVEVDTIGFGMWVAYAFVDMVCVSQQPGVCDPVSGIGEASVTQIPQGLAFQEVLMLSLEACGLEGAVEQAELFDARGRFVRGTVVQDSSSLQWYLPELSNGLYVLQLKLRDRPSVRIRSLKY
ncbi:MAG TPA: hypothetical protein PKY96_13815 [Flavobacteriales bacterium]|nr:hypothetical protein [Flavobacteriales bacterium]